MESYIPFLPVIKHLTKWQLMRRGVYLGWRFGKEYHLPWQGKHGSRNRCFWYQHLQSRQEVGLSYETSRPIPTRLTPSSKALPPKGIHPSILAPSAGDRVFKHTSLPSFLTFMLQWRESSQTLSWVVFLKLYIELAPERITKGTKRLLGLQKILY